MNNRTNTTIPEEVISLFLNELQIKKLNILNNITSDGITLEYIEKIFNYTPRKAKDFAKNFVEEINSYIIESKGCLVILNNTIYFSDNVHEYNFIKIIQETRETYVEHSSLYRFLTYILKKRNFDVRDITENIFYSESYVYKLIAKVNILFSSLNLKIYFEKNNDMFSLCGNEIEIRYLYYFTISVVAKGTKQYLDLIDSKFSDSFIGSYSKEFNRLSPIGKTRVYYFIAIFSSSISTQNFLPELSDEIKELVCIFTRYNENTNLDASGPPKNRYILNENLVLFCIISYFTQEFYTDFEKSKIGNTLSNIKDNHVVDTCKALLQQVCSKYSLDTFTFNLMLYTLCNNMIVIHYLKLYKFMYLKENHYYGSVDTKFIKQCIDLNLTYFTSKEDYAKLKSNFFQIIVSEVSLVPTVKIYIEFFQQPEYKSFIKNTLKNIYNRNLIEITENYKKADIIISDTIGYDVDQENYYYFKNIFDKKSWIKLGEYINKKVINKNLY
ncbi:helix-turn-helix domain-containing protein [Lactococcus sp. DD01]|uniref:helix-turn-helix domain-containing protein n=1 Tax=Lactococcus sp. DD01 TaxID=1776443 RepID=UPI0007766217|nr:helix-turn-helix domain-containing protein [Lactococcus sp. DD01]KXT62908.1 hypothetical protein LACDD01_00298 [Lactococcus sp. DD01]